MREILDRIVLPANGPAANLSDIPIIVAAHLIGAGEEVGTLVSMKDWWWRQSDQRISPRHFTSRSEEITQFEFEHFNGPALNDRCRSDGENKGSFGTLHTISATALRNLKYMLEPASSNQRTASFLRDLLYIESTRDSAVLVDAQVITAESLRGRVYLDVPDYTGYGGFSFREDDSLEYSRGFLSRLKMALFGGLALIVPMLIMKLHPHLLTQLLTASCFVLAVAIILALYMKDVHKKDILAATAAYAAVLVVFVGTGG